MISRERLRQADKHARRRWHGQGMDRNTLPTSLKWQMYRKTTKRCSCMMCGNPRSYQGLTVQERRARLYAGDD